MLDYLARESLWRAENLSRDLAEEEEELAKQIPGKIFPEGERTRAQAQSQGLRE